MATIVADKSLGCVLEIEGVYYSAHRIPPGLDDYAVVLHNHKNNEQHQCRRDGAAWRCSCKAFRFRKPPCKHLKALAPLLSLAEELTR